MKGRKEGRWNGAAAEARLLLQKRGKCARESEQGEGGAFMAGSP